MKKKVIQNHHFIFGLVLTGLFLGPLNTQGQEDIEKGIGSNLQQTESNQETNSENKGERAEVKSEEGEKAKEQSQKLEKKLTEKVRNEIGETFLITFLDDHIKVVSPTQYSKGLSLIVDNRTFSDLVGKVQNQDRQLLGHLTIKANSYKSFPLADIKEQKIYFIPLAPAFQEIELMLGQKSYEIPSKKEN